MLERIRHHLGEVFVGDAQVVEKALIVMLAQGHLLIEDVPGVGKTTLARALAGCFGGHFQHIQFTSDLLPSDLLGVNVFDPSRQTFQFHEGPIFANFILADELNRTTPKTQSALLEAMQSNRVTVDKTTYPLPAPFMVIATQNPLEVHGTFPLPLSQLDRFMMRLALGYPSAEQEAAILVAYRDAGEHVLEALTTPETLVEWRRQVTQVRVDDALVGYLTALAQATRRHAGLVAGVSPRALLALQRAAQARALLQGREYVIPDDIKTLTVDVLAHRLVPADVALGAAPGERTAAVLNEIIQSTALPR